MYLESIGVDPESNGMRYTAWHFDNNEQDANELVQLVLQGKKRATASSLWVYEAESEPVPEVGDLSVVTDWSGVAKCIIKTTRVDVVPFRDVSEEFARTEGEGDGSLAYWRRVHRTFFTQECAEIERAFTADMPVVCEEFDVVFR